MREKSYINELISIALYLGIMTLIILVIILLIIFKVEN